MNVKIEKIGEAERQIDKLVRQEKAMRREYLADGTVDAKEQKQLDSVGEKISKLKGIIANLRAQIEAARRAWEARGTDWTQAKSDLADLAAWGHAGLPKVKTEADKIEPLTKDQQWEEATKQLDVLLKALAPVVKDYHDQQAAKSGYDSLHKDTETRVQRLEAAQPQTPDLKAMRTDLGSGLDAAGKSAAAKDYVSALKAVKDMQSDLTAAETVARDARGEKAEFDKEWGSTGPRVTEAITCVPPEAGDLESKRKGLETGKAQIDEMLTRHDYAAAIPLAKDMGARSDAYMAEYAAVVDAKTLYEKRLPRIDAKLAEIAKCEFSDLTVLQEEITGAETVMRGAAGAGGFKQALQEMDKLDALIVKFDAAYESARLGKDFAERRKKLAPRVDKARVNGFGPADAISLELTGDADAADKAAGATKYTEALALLDDVEVKLGDYEAKRAAQEKARTEYENGAPQLLQRFDVIARCEYPQLDGQGSALIALRDQMQAAVETGDYVLAVEQMYKLEKALSVVETTLAALQAKQTEYETRLAPLVSRFDAAMVSDFAQLEDERTALLTARADMESAAKNRDFPLAVDHMNKVERLLNDLDAQRGTIEGLKKQYEATLKQIEAGLKAAGDNTFEEIASKKAAIVALRTEMLASAQEEDFAVALEKAKALIPLLTEFAKLDAQVKEYRKQLEALKPKLETVKGFTYKSLKERKEKIDKRFTEMTALAAKAEMTDALKKMEELKKQVDEIIALQDQLRLKEAVYKDRFAELKPECDAIAKNKITKEEVKAAAKEVKEAFEKFKELGDKDEFIKAVDKAPEVRAKIRAFQDAVEKHGDAKEAYEMLLPIALAGYASVAKDAEGYENLKAELGELTALKKAVEEAGKGDSPDWEAARDKAKKLIDAVEKFRAKLTESTNRAAALKAEADGVRARFKAQPKEAAEKAKDDYEDVAEALADLDKALAEKKLDRADEKLAAAKAALDRVDAALKTKEQLKADYEARLATLTPRVTAAEKSRFVPGLKTELEAVRDALKAMTERGADEDYQGGIKAAADVEKALASFTAAEDKLKPTDAVLEERFAEINKDAETIKAALKDLDLVNAEIYGARNNAAMSSYDAAKKQRAAMNLAEADATSKQVRAEQRAILADIEALEDSLKKAKEKDEGERTLSEKIKDVAGDVIDEVADAVKEEVYDFIDSKIEGAKDIGKGLEQVWEGDGVIEKLEGVIDVGKGVAEATGAPRKVKKGLKTAEEIYDAGKKAYDYLKE